MGFSLIWNINAKWIDGSVVIDFYISNNVRREPDKFPGLPDNLEISVYRKKAEDFYYVKMRDEYFQTEDFNASELVFSGKPERKTENMFRWTDNEVETGECYTYWLTTEMNDRPMSPVYVRAVDNDVIWTHEKTLAESRRIAGSYEGVDIKTYGRSIKGLDLVGLKKGNMDRAVVIVAGIHAAEAGQFTALDIFENFLKNKDDDYFAKVGFAVFPASNPDEADRMAHGHVSYLRTNSAGVDLNRNFPSDWEIVSDMYGLSTDDPESATYRGPTPASEPETKAVLAFMEGINPISVFSLHCYPGGITHDQFFGPGTGKDDEEYKAACMGLAVPYSEKFRNGEYPGQMFVAYGTTPGSFPVWVYRNFHVPAFDVESYDYYIRNHPEALQACNFRADTALMEEISSRHYRGMENYLSEYMKNQGLL